MKNVANRLIVFAVSALAFGTAAFGQTTRMTAEIPFAFRTVTGTLPAGSYLFTEAHAGQGQHVTVAENTSTGKSWMVGLPQADNWAKPRAASLEFTCVGNACSLQALNTGTGRLVYQTPRPRKDERALVSVVSVPVRIANGE
jgi:outer membrane protein assembly factor BamB